jgi:hypothetical protein
MTTELPRDLSQAVSGASSVLVRGEKLQSVMCATAAEISAALAEERRLTGELGRAEIEGGDTGKLRDRLNVIVSERSASARKRASASDALLHIDAELTATRQTLDRARQLYATGIIAEFGGRWQQACDVLAGLRAEGEALSKASGLAVLMPPPYVARTISYLAEEPVELHPVAASVPVAPPVLPPALVVVAGIFDRIDNIRGLTQSVRQGVQLTQTYFATARERGGMKAEFGGLFEVIKDFDLLGTHFQRGQLLDRTVLLEGSLERMWKGRSIQPVVEGAAVVAA